MKPLDLSGIRPLIVDHDQDMRLLMVRMLKKFSCRNVVTAADTHEAFDEMGRPPCPDVIIADYSIPPANGIDFVRKIRTSPDSPNRYVPIILTSGGWKWTEIGDARNAGVNEILVKPFSPKALSGRMHAIIHNPRPFVRIDDYFGPDRRRQLKEGPGLERRKKQVALIDAPLETGVSREDPLDRAAVPEGEPTQDNIDKYFDR